MRSIKAWLRLGVSRGKSMKFVREGLHTKVLNIFGPVISGVLLVCTGIVIYEFGFKDFWINHPVVDFWLRFFLVTASVLILARIVLEAFIKKKKWARAMNIGGWVFMMLLTFYVLPLKASLSNTSSGTFVFLKVVLYGGVTLSFITEISYYLQFIYRRNINPGILFVGSFGFLILVGAFLLKLPNATYDGLSGLDALFTSTSAVCVTGLTVVDTAKYFTPFGQLIIMLLIQVGGLGIMTFAGLLAYAIAGHTSFRTQVAFKDMLSGKQLGNIMGFVYKVVLVTFLFEGIGAAAIYFSVDESLFQTQLDRLFFAVFHSVSAFCNAGFSTLSGGLHEEITRFNYPLHMLIALLVILGGMGFPIVFNLYRYLKVKITNLIHAMYGRSKRFTSQG